MSKTETGLRKEIWIVNQYARTPAQSGGVRHFDFASGLVGQGYEITVFSSDVTAATPNSKKVSGDQMFEVETFPGIHGLRFVWVNAPLYRRNNWRRALNMVAFASNCFRTARMIEGSPICTIGSSPSPLAALCAWAIAKQKRSRYVLELLDLWPQCLVDMGLAEWSMPIKMLRILERFLYRVADKIIVLAKGSREYLTMRGVPTSKVFYIPNGVHLGYFPLENLDASKRLAARKMFGFSRFTVVYTGAHGPANSLDTLIRAAHIIQQKSLPVDLVLVGGGFLKPRLKQLAESLCVKNVHFWDPIPKTDIPQLLYAADAGVITLRSIAAFSYGVSPGKLFDYMAAALPIICAIPGDLADVVDEFNCGICATPEDAESIATAIQRLLEMPDDERHEMGMRGRKLAQQEFSREVLAKKLVGALE